MTFLGMSYDEWDKIEKPAFWVSNKRSGDDNDEPALVHKSINCNHYVVRGNLESKENVKEYFFDQKINKEPKSILKTTSNLKIVSAIKNCKLQIMWKI